jgi:hypothetical protein
MQIVCRIHFRVRCFQLNRRLTRLFSAFYFVEVTDLDQDPAGFFGRMIEGFIKVTPGMVCHSAARKAFMCWRMTPGCSSGMM